MTFTQDRDGVRAQLRDQQGRPHDTTVAWLVGCDGAHSLVRYQLGVAFEGEAFEQRFAVADVRVAWPLPGDEVFAFLNRGNFMAFFPMASGLHRVAIAYPAAAEPDGSVSVAELQESLDRNGRPTGARITDVAWTWSGSPSARAASAQWTTPSLGTCRSCCNATGGSSASPCATCSPCAPVCATRSRARREATNRYLSAKFGVLYANSGAWQGRQLVPRAWVQDPTVVPTGGSSTPAPGHQYFWWVQSDRSPQAFFARGKYAQHIYVVAKTRLVLVRFGRDRGYEHWPELLSGLPGGWTSRPRARRPDPQDTRATG